MTKQDLLRLIGEPKSPRRAMVSVLITLIGISALILLANVGDAAQDPASAGPVQAAQASSDGVVELLHQRQDLLERLLKDQAQTHDLMHKETMSLLSEVVVVGQGFQRQLLNHHKVDRAMAERLDLLEKWLKGGSLEQNQESSGEAAPEPPTQTAEARWERQQLVLALLESMKMERLFGDFKTVEAKGQLFYEVPEVLHIRILKSYDSARLVGHVMKIENLSAEVIRMRPEKLRMDGMLAASVKDEILGPSDPKATAETPKEHPSETLAYVVVDKTGHEFGGLEWEEGER